MINVQLFLTPLKIPTYKNLKNLQSVAISNLQT